MGEKGEGMPTRTILLSVIASALLFGVCVSGCNRQSRSKAVAMKNSARAQMAARPAEVLSASAHRAPPRHYDVPVRPVSVDQAPVRMASAPRYPPAAVPPALPETWAVPPNHYAMAAPAGYAPRPSSPHYVAYSEPLPEPVPVVYPASAAIPAPYQPYTPAPPAQYMTSADLVPLTPTYPTTVARPELTVAKAVLTPLPYEPQSAEPRAARAVERAPIPELGPRGVAEPVVPKRRAAEILMSTSEEADRREALRAIEPLAKPSVASAPEHGWVASPVTAMRSPQYAW